MTFKYSICHPDKKEIEYLNEPIKAKKVLEIAKNYPWLEQLKSADSIDQSKVYYSPSLDFTCLENDRSFCLTAYFNDRKELEFSLWYNRPKKVKILFGLLGETEKFVVDDIWEYSFEEAIKNLEHFVYGSYPLIEALYP